MPADLLQEWQVPSAIASVDRRLNWVNEVTQEGANWLKIQRGTGDFKKALAVLSGSNIGPKIPEYRSQLTTNHLKRNVREIVGALSKLRPFWGYHSENSAFKAEAEVLNKTVRAWYLHAKADRSIKDALDYAAATCTGWIRPVYSRDMGGQGRGDIRLLSYGSPCVLPCQLPASGDFQQAYAVTILDELPIYMAHSMFPAFQQQLKPTSSMYWYANEIRTSAKGNLWNRLSMWRRSSSTDTGLTNLLCPIRYTYVVDLSVNTTDQVIPMGDPGTSWYYEVPFVGMDLPAGRDPKSGTVRTRRADVNDCRLYPRRRLIISSESCITYDGPAFDLHGRLPAIPFCLDRWPWEPIGFSPIRDGYDLQTSMDEILRGVIDKLRAQNDPALAYDINAVTSKEAKQFDPMQPRARAGFDGNAGAKPFEMAMDPNILMVRPEQLTAYNTLKEAMDEQHAIKDVMALAQARMSQDDLEKLLEIEGPIIEDMSRSMEPPLVELGEQVKYLIFQYFDVARTISYVGADQMSMQTFDFEPNDLVPSHLPGEDVSIPSATSRAARARHLADNMPFMIQPNSIHEMTQMSNKLGLMQLRKANVMISSETIASAWSVPNYGTCGGVTEIEKWQAEQELQLQLALRAKAMAAALDPAGAGDIPVLPQAINPEGRPPSGQAAPAMKLKDGGERLTVTESEGGGRVV
jgi:hypothetical protein